MFSNNEIVEKRSVLFVDDIELSLHSIERCLLDEPYHKLFANSNKEVFEIIRKEEVHVIVTDMCMPEMTGLELLRTVRHDYSDIIGMILTEYMQDTELQAAEENGEIFKLIPKSWNNEENFKKIIMEAIDRYNLQSERETVKQKN